MSSIFKAWKDACKGKVPQAKQATSSATKPDSDEVAALKLRIAQLEAESTNKTEDKGDSPKSEEFDAAAADFGLIKAKAEELGLPLLTDEGKSIHHSTLRKQVQEAIDEAEA